MAILLSGLVGFCSERVRESEPGTRPEIFDLPAGRTMAAVVGAGLLGTTGEAGLLHFRGAFHNPFMMLPVTLPPLGAILLASAAAGRTRPRAPIHTLVDAAVGRDGFCRRRFPRLRRIPQHGRLAQLESERPQRTAASGAAEFCRPCARRSRRARPDEGSSRCLISAKLSGARTAIPATTFWPSVLGPSWNEQTRRVITRRLSIGAEPRFFTAEEFQTVTAIAIPHRAAARGASADPGGVRWWMTNWRAVRRTAIGWRECRAMATRGGLASGRSMRKPSCLWRTLSTRLSEGLQDTLLARMQRGELKSPHGAA